MPLGIIVLLGMMAIAVCLHYVFAIINLRKGRSNKAHFQIEMGRLLLAALVVATYMSYVVSGNDPLTVLG